MTRTKCCAKCYKEPKYAPIAMCLNTNCICHKELCYIPPNAERTGDRGRITTQNWEKLENNLAIEIVTMMENNIFKGQYPSIFLEQLEKAITPSIKRHFESALTAYKKELRGKVNEMLSELYPSAHLIRRQALEDFLSLLDNK